MGTLEINFANKPAHLCIYALENSENPLYSTEKAGKTVSLMLNSGCYYIHPHSKKSSEIYNKLGFQINTCKQKVRIEYDQSNTGYFR